MSYTDPQIAKKLDDALFWYYTTGRVIRWGYIAKDRHTEQDFDDQETAYKAYRAYVASQPALSTAVSRLPLGSDVCIDFDGTIYPGTPGDQRSNMVPPDPICVLTIQQLHNSGHKIIVFSCRSNPAVIQDSRRAQQMTASMEDYLRKHEIPYDEVFVGKPNYSVVIDDRAEKFTGSWTDMRSALEMPEVAVFSSQE